MNPHDPNDPPRKPPLGLLSGLRIGEPDLSPERSMSGDPPRTHLERRREAWHEILICHEGTLH
jgi:hypothetical protein